MYLSGSIAEFKSLLLVAEDLRANAIHFLAPDVVFILARNKEDYVYLKTGIIIGQSVMMPKTCYVNLHLYIKAAKRGFSIPDSPFYLEVISSLRIRPGQLSFNDAERLTLEVDLPVFPLKRDVDFKLESVIQSSYDLNAPYLRLSLPEVDELNRQMSRYKKRFAGKSSTGSDNALIPEGDQLIWYFMHEQQDVRIETDILLFATNPKYPHTFCYFSDRAFYLLRWLARITPVDDVIFLPRKDYCVLEGYLGSMTIKVRTRIKNDLPFLEEVMGNDMASDGIHG